MVQDKNKLIIENTLRVASDIMSIKGFTLRDYQVDGVNWMISREVNQSHAGGILADDPGLGKTIQTAALMVGIPKKTLIIVPTAVLSQWYDIMSNIFGEDVIYLHYGQEKRKTSHEILSTNFDICITSHGCAVSRKKQTYETILHIPNFWERIVIDEGHVIRNKNTKMHKTAMNYSRIGGAKWILSGTPVQNRTADIVNIIQYIGVPLSRIKTNLDSCIEKYLLRRTKKVLMDEVFREVDFKTHVIPFKTREEQMVYNQIETFSLNELVDLKYSGTSGLKYEMFRLEVIIRLRQASCHPQIAIDSMNSKYEAAGVADFTSISTKITALVQDVVAADGLSLIFCHFMGEMLRIQERLRLNGFTSKLYNGSMSRAKRDAILEGFKTGAHTSKVLIVQIMAGGVGLNLQEFSNVFIASPDWNPTNEIQAISRAHRYGQTKIVTVHKYILTYNMEFIDTFDEIDEDADTIDERILKKQISKRELMVRLLKDDTLKFNENIELSKCVELGLDSIVSPYGL